MFVGRLLLYDRGKGIVIGREVGDRGEWRQVALERRETINDRLVVT